MKNMFVRATMCAAALTMAISTATRAEDGIDIPGDFSGSVLIGTDYVFRGISQTNEGPTIQGSLDYAHESGVYVGVWASNIDFDNFIEVDYYIGVGNDLGNSGFSYDVGFNYFDYPGASFQDYWEAYAYLGYDFGVASISVGAQYSPNFFAETDDGWYPNGSVTIPITGWLALDGTVGYQTIEDNADFGTPDYTDWSVGLTATVEGFDLGIRYHDTDLSSAECFGGDDICDARVVFTASRTL